MKESTKDLLNAKEKSRFINDIILILFFCVIAVIMSFILYHREGHDDIMLKISVDGNIAVTYEFNKEDAIDKTFPLGTGNVVVLKDGQVYMESADCPDGLCMKQGKISLSGQSIVCLPHKVVVKLSNIAEEDKTKETYNDDRLDVMPR